MTYKKELFTMNKENELKRIVLEYVDKYDEQRIQLEVNIDKIKKQVKINKKLFDS